MIMRIECEASGSHANVIIVIESKSEQKKEKKNQLICRKMMENGDGRKSGFSSFSSLMCCMYMILCLTRFSQTYRSYHNNRGKPVVDTEMGPLGDETGIYIHTHTYYTQAHAHSEQKRDTK